jgi:glycosyltransferase involved in cell wall biosynthesis
MSRLYSAIIPLYNRPDEIEELLESLTLQTYINFEVVIIEDGSTNDAKSVVEKYKTKLKIQYHFKENGGQGFARNVGFEMAKGEYFVIFDSDAIIPPHYFQAVENYLNTSYVDAFGGPDAAHESFSPIQKAISYSMTSLFTTGGIRGREKHVGQFHPRSFNMGLSREVYDKVGGFVITRMGEDIEFSIRIINNGFATALIPEAFIYHKRRTSLSQFYKQLHFFGRARINIWRFYSSELKSVHLLPAFFVVALWTWLLSFVVFKPLFFLGLAVLTLYYVAIFIDSSIQNKSMGIGLLSIPTSFIQLYAYGIGFFGELKTKITKG